MYPKLYQHSVILFSTIAGLLLLGCDSVITVPPDEIIDPPPQESIDVEFITHTDGQRMVGGRLVPWLAGKISEDAKSKIEKVSVLHNGDSVEAIFDADEFGIANFELANQENHIEATIEDSLGRIGKASINLYFPFIKLETFQAASVVLGQPDMVTDVESSGMRWPTGLAEHNGKLFFTAQYNFLFGYNSIPDQINAPADFSLGSYTRGPGMDQFDTPGSISIADGKMYVADNRNHRILIFNSVPTESGVAADAFLGTGTDYGCAPDIIPEPKDLSIGGNKLAVVDEWNSRVLIWNSVPSEGGILPDLVLGQGDFSSCSANHGLGQTPDASSLRFPQGVWTDGNKLVVADYYNGRVLIWNEFPTQSGTPADVVLGKPNFTTKITNLLISPVSEALISAPSKVFSNGNQLIVSDQGANRILVWDSFPTASFTPADHVLGHPNFTNKGCHGQTSSAYGDPTASTLCAPKSLLVTSDDQHLIVADHADNRVVIYDHLNEDSSSDPVGEEEEEDEEEAGDSGDDGLGGGLGFP